MKDIDEIRRANLRRLDAEKGSPSIVAKLAGMTLAQYLNLRDGAKDSKTGNPRGMRKQTAWKIEDAVGKPRGWLDVDHTEQSEPKMGDVLGRQIFPLRCPECGQVSHKSFIQLEMNDRLPCGSCGVVFNINSQYGNGELKMFLEALGYSGFILRENRQFD